MLAKKLDKYLTEHHVKFKSISHPETFTAHETAQCAHIPDKQMAKTLIVKIDDKFVMVVLPANVQLNLKRLKADLKAIKGDNWGKNLALAEEQEIGKLFGKDCELGAMPPIGPLYKMETFVADSLSDNDEIAFNGGSHEDLVLMNYEDWWKLVHPSVLPSC